LRSVSNPETSCAIDADSLRSLLNCVLPVKEGVREGAAVLTTVELDASAYSSIERPLFRGELSLMVSGVW
jgi:hypothetical protein